MEKYIMDEPPKLKLLAVFVDQRDGSTAKVYRDAPWEEYRVKFYDSSGKHMDASDYHTSDKLDAFNTAGQEHPDIIRTK